MRATATTDKARREVIAVRILWEAAEYRADAIVIGSRGKSALGDWAAGLRNGTDARLSNNGNGGNSAGIGYAAYMTG